MSRVGWGNDDGTKQKSWKPVWRVFSYVSRYPGMAAGTLGCAVVSTAMLGVFPRITGLVMDEVRAGRGERLWWYAGLSLGAFLVRDVFNALRIQLNNTFEQRVIFDLRSDLYAHIQRLPLRWFDNRTTGDLMTRILEDVNAVERVLIDGIEGGVIAVLQIAVFAALMFWTDPTLALLSMIPMPFLALGAMFYTSTAPTRYRQQRKASSAMNALLHDNLAGIRQIKTFVREREEHARFDSVSDRLREATLVVMRAWSVYHPSMNFFSSLGMVLIAGFGGKAVLDGRMSVGELTQFLVIGGLLYDPIARLHSLNQLVQAGRAAGERVFEILDEPAETSAAEIAAEGTATQAIRGDVRYRDVSFSYDEKVPVLKNITLHAAPGQTVALVGPTGSGKSTLVNLLTRFYEHDSGEITVDDQPVGALPKSVLRSAVGLVTQESFLFNGSVRDNLRLGSPSATDEKLWSALAAANARDFVERLPEGLDTVVGERGIKLSVGEKQRVSIARALLKDPPILILDEATASVDNETERLIQSALERLLKRRTSFVIAHRLSTVMHADQILVMDRGRIVERGTHAELLAENGIYARLCAAGLE